MSLPERNEPCPCGSGKKFKKCCMDNPGIRQREELQVANSVQGLLLMSEQHINAGNFAHAEHLLQQVLAVKPNHPQANYLCGIALASQGKRDEAISSYESAIKNKKSYYQAMGNLASMLRDKGQSEESEKWCRRALVFAPKEVLLLNNLANALLDQGRLGEGEATLRKALKISPAYADAYYNLGVNLRCQGLLSESVTNLRKALDFNPKFAEAYYNLGNNLKDIGDLDGAINSYRQALAFKPHYPEALCNLGAALKGLGRLDDAVINYRMALKIKPDFAEAHYNLGNALLDLGRLDEVMESCRRALELNPNFAEAHVAIGNALSECGEHDDAVESYRLAFEIKPDYILAYNNLLFTLNYHPDKSGEEIFAAYREYDTCFGVPYRTEWRPHANSSEFRRRLKVGYVSPDFRQHSCAYFLEPLLSHHDKTQVEVYAYAELVQEDEITKRYRSYTDQWVPTAGMSDEALAERIRADGIDILVDLAGHTAKNRLQVFARKPAPVSLSWLGFGYTTGLSAIDYLLTDATSAPAGSEGLFSETPWRLKTPGYVYRPAEGMGMVSDLPALARGYVTFGTLTRSVRINHRTTRAWSEILKRVEGSRLAINSGNFREATTQEALVEKFAAHGIARERLEIGYHSPPWGVLRDMDIGLDCFPHNSGTTLFETLYMGVPFVTLAGRPSVGLLGSSVLEGAGHPEWIARTEDEYIELAVALASNLPKLAALRGGLRGKMESGPLMDEAGFARKVEAAYREMFEKWVGAMNN